MTNQQKPRQKQEVVHTDRAKQKREPDGHPPQPPQVPKKFEFTRSQLLGMPLILLIPILALFGLFGETASEIEIIVPACELEVRTQSR